MKHRADFYPLAAVLGFAALRLILVGVDAPFHLGLLLFCLFGMAVVWSVKHNVLHEPIFIRPTPNRLLSLWLSIFTGTSMRNTSIVHLANHHLHNNSDEDWTTVHQAKAHDWRLLSLLGYPLRTIPRMITDKKAYVASRRPAVRKTIRRESWIIFAGLLLCLMASPLATLWYVILPMMYGQWLLITINYLQHDDCDHDSEFDHANNFTGRWYNWCFFNGGLHTAHHNFPEAHWSELPRLHQEIEPLISPRHNKPNLLKSFLREYVFNHRPGRGQAADRGPKPTRLHSRNSSITGSRKV